VRILLLPGTYDGKNLGDLAMLEVAVERLARELPGSAIHVLTYAPEALQRACPTVQPASLHARDRWRKAKLLPRRLWREPEARFRQRYPMLFSRLWRAKATLLRGKYLFPLSFLNEIQRADALFVTGCGMFNDCFPETSLQALELLEMALKRGIVTAAFSQGVGPLEHPTVCRRATEILPRLDAIFIREEHGSGTMLQRLGVAPDRILFTGDDAVELAWAARSESVGAQLGFNLRVASYSAVGEQTFTTVRRTLEQKARDYRVSLLGVPITRGDIDCDLKTAQRMLDGLDVPGTAGTDIDSPLQAIRRTAECRVIVTGSYHLGVFALSQGIPAVCIAGSPYYTGKFLGLADAFGSGCTVLQAHEAGFDTALSIAIDQFWEQAPALRAPLLEAAEGQVELANAAYRTLLNRFRPQRRTATVTLDSLVASS
jgi:polysaccharide pyruvyl transferase WcaK-like protein